MDAAVLHSIGTRPRCEHFAEPVVTDDEALIHVRVAALKPVDKQIASGSHYATPPSLPFICGTDGVGHLDDGRRVFFGGCRPPYGAMAQRTVVPKGFVFPVPDTVSDELAAAIVNPGVSAWLALAFRAKLAPRENVLVLGATGVAGRLAVMVAKLLGASRVVAAGRNQHVLNSLIELGADGTIPLDRPVEEVRESFVQQAGKAGFQVVIDYLWGQPTEIFLSAITTSKFEAVGTETRLIQVGETAGPVISLPAAVLRSTALTILGTAGIPNRSVLEDALQQVMAHAATGKLYVDTVRVPLTSIEAAWERDPQGRRIVVIP
jgi:NADPH2:quinone reductase